MEKAISIKDATPEAAAGAKIRLPATGTITLLVLLIVSMPLMAIEFLTTAPTFDLRTDAGHDFALLYAAAHTLRLHLDPYQPLVLARQAGREGLLPVHLFYGTMMTQPYVYPPIFAWLAIPITLLPMVPALLLWRVLSLALIFFGSLGLIRAWSAEDVPFYRSPHGAALLSAVIATSPLAIYVLHWGNPVVLVYGAFGGWVYALRRQSSRWDIAAGALMSVALLKPQLAVPLAIISFACCVRGEARAQRLRRVLIGCGASVGFFLALDLLVVPPIYLIEWPVSVAYLSTQLGLQPDMPSLYGLVKYTFQAIALPASFAIGTTLLGVVAVVALYKRLSATWRPFAVFGLLAVIWCFATPYAHGNDQLLFLPGALAVAMPLFARAGQPSRHTPRRSMSRAVVILALVVMWLGPVLVFIPTTDVHLPVSLAMAVAPLLLLAAFAVSARSHRRPDAASPSSSALAARAV